MKKPDVALLSKGGVALNCRRRTTAADATPEGGGLRVLATAYLSVYPAAAMLALWAIWRLFRMAVIIGIIALVAVGALVEIAAMMARDCIAAVGWPNS